MYGNLNKIKYNINYMEEKLVSPIKKAETKALKDAKLELLQFSETLSTNSLTTNYIYKTLISWRTNYSLNEHNIYSWIINLTKISKYNFIDKNDFEILEKIALELYNTHLKSPLYPLNSFFKDLETDTYSYIKSELLYLGANNFIEHINKNNSDLLNLPHIENFEENIFKKLESQNTTLKETNIQMTKEIRQLGIDIIDLNYKNKNHILEIEKLKTQLSYKENYNNILKNEILKKDFVYVNQFDKLYWGDNYPALKVLFNFLQKYNIIDCNWSYFASIMSIENLQPISFNSYQFNKTEIGYLLERIKPFFLNEYKNTKSRYIDFLTRKIFIDYERIDEIFHKNYIRDYKSSKNQLKHYIEIENLCINIGELYK